MSITLYKHHHPAWGVLYLDNTDSEYSPKLTAYTEAEEATHIRQIVALALASVDLADFDRCGLDEVVGRTIRAMGSASTSNGGDHG